MSQPNMPPAALAEAAAPDTDGRGACSVVGAGSGTARGGPGCSTTMSWPGILLAARASRHPRTWSSPLAIPERMSGMGHLHLHRRTAYAKRTHAGSRPGRRPGCSLHDPRRRSVHSAGWRRGPCATGSPPQSSAGTVLAHAAWRCPMSARRVLRNNGLSLVLLAIFLATLVGQ